jgi:hypothetical protein
MNALSAKTFPVSINRRVFQDSRVGALPWGKVLLFAFQKYSIGVLFAKLRGIPLETSMTGEGKRLSNFTQSLSKID